MSANKLVETIRTIVRAELKKTLKPMLKEVLKPLVKEMVEGRVNAVLAEKFVQNLSVSQVVMKEQAAPQVSPEPTPQQRKEMTERRRQELLERMGVANDPMSQLIYGDVNLDQPMRGTGGMSTPNGFIDDEDDEGVDLSKFGIKI